MVMSAQFIDNSIHVFPDFLGYEYSYMVHNCILKETLCFMYDRSGLN